LPFGKDGVDGPSIRFAEAAQRCMTNMWSHGMVTFDDDEKRVLSVMVTDLETNVTYEDTITISKTVERRYLKENQECRGTRLNSHGDTLYIVAASEGELRAKQGAEMSKAIRTLTLRHVPGDLFEAAWQQVNETARKDVKDNPGEARRKLVDAFAGLGINPEHLVAYLRHPIEQTQPAEVEKLRGIYAAIKDGQITWSEVVINQGTPAQKSKTSRTKEELDKKRQANGRKPEPQKEPAQPPPEEPGKYDDVGPPPMTEGEAKAATGQDEFSEKAGF